MAKLITLKGKAMKQYLRLTTFSIFIMLASCNTQTPALTEKNADVQEIINTDKAFSDMSRQLGMKKAFIQYISKDGVILRPGYLPIVGADAIDYLSQINDTAYTISWVPSHGEIAKSGEMGYTYGIYTLAAKDTTLKGTYVSIWKKQSDGEWKFVLDSGNEGVGLGAR
ncbi:MAG: hypothetical protein JSS98_01890 [Bacteroidetes bacterium]|nr:hypothetical protein [Bacteroidota bacterium]